jgi:hypothetical protein
MQQTHLAYIDVPQRVMSITTGLPINDVQLWDDKLFFSQDIQSLLPSKWVESGPMDLFATLDTQEHDQVQYIPSSAYHTFVCALSTGNYDSVYDHDAEHAQHMLSRDAWIIMINYGNVHWQLLCIIKPGTTQQQALLMDSMLGPALVSTRSSKEVPSNWHIVQAFTTFYINAVMATAHMANDPTQQDLLSICYVPKQPNGNDCGIFVLLNLLFLVNNLHQFIHAVTMHGNRTINFTHWYSPNVGSSYRCYYFQRYGNLLDQYSIPS